METKQIDKLYVGFVILYPELSYSQIKVLEILAKTTKYDFLLEIPIHIEIGVDVIYSKEKEKAIQFVKNIVLKQKEECQKILNLLDSVDLDNLLKEEGMLQNEPER